MAKKSVKKSRPSSGAIEIPMTKRQIANTMAKKNAKKSKR